MWTAAFMTNATTRDMFIDCVYKYAADGANSVPLSDWYDTLSGVYDGFIARPVVGGHLALVGVALVVSVNFATHGTWLQLAL